MIWFQKAFTAATTHHFHSWWWFCKTWVLLVVPEVQNTSNQLTYIVGLKSSITEHQQIWNKQISIRRSIDSLLSPIISIKFQTFPSSPITHSKKNVLDLASVQFSLRKSDLKKALAPLAKVSKGWDFGHWLTQDWRKLFVKARHSNSSLIIHRVRWCNLHHKVPFPRRCGAGWPMGCEMTIMFFFSGKVMTLADVFFFSLLANQVLPSFTLEELQTMPISHLDCWIELCQTRKCLKSFETSL